MTKHVLPVGDDILAALVKVLARPTRDTLIREYLGAIASFPWYQKP